MAYVFFFTDYTNSTELAFLALRMHVFDSGVDDCMCWRAKSYPIMGGPCSEFMFSPRLAFFFSSQLHSHRTQAKKEPAAAKKPRANAGKGKGKQIPSPEVCVMMLHKTIVLQSDAGDVPFRSPNPAWIALT
jgi:hypothetical protein